MSKPTGFPVNRTNSGAPVTHSHGQHLVHTHTAEEYANHQRPIDGEKFERAPQPVEMFEPGEPGEPGYYGVDLTFSTDADARISDLEAKLAAAEAEATGRWLRMDLVMALLRTSHAGSGAKVIEDMAAALEGYIETGESR